MSENLLMLISIGVAAFFVTGALGMALGVLRNILACGTLGGLGLVALGIMTEDPDLSFIGATAAVCCYPVWHLLSPPAKK